MMKNLLIYTGSQKKFDDVTETLARIQIDNSLDLGWKKNDIFIATDFKFSYNGVVSYVIDEDIYYPYDPKANKIAVLNYLMKKGLVGKDEVYWCHDFDAYEANKINESDLDLSGVDIGLTHYTYKPEWQCGSMFIKNTSEDIINLVDQETRATPYNSRNNEKTLTRLIRDGKVPSNRYKQLNVTYNLTKRYLGRVYPQAQKPIKVLHFLPSDQDALMKHSALNMFMYGKNDLKIPLMDGRLIKIFNEHGIK